MVNLARAHQSFCFALVTSLIVALATSTARADVPIAPQANVLPDKLAQNDAADAQPNSVEGQIRAALSELPGSTAMAFTEITNSADQPRLLFGVNQDQELAVGSSFKLFIFGTLADEVNQYRRRVEDIMRLRPEWVGPPASEMATWPMGSPATLYTYTLKMISISDNTATDHLIHLLGRQNIEKQMAEMGHSHPERNRPLLMTREMVMLRDRNEGMPGKKYQEMDEAARRNFLTTHFQGVPDFEKVDFDTSAYNVAEWYASPLDMAKALDWIYRHTQDEQPAADMRKILAVDPKLSYDEKVWKFVGFKGGSEDQLMAGNWLMQNANGKWYTMHIYWNNPAGNVDPAALQKATDKILTAVQATLPAN